MNECTSRLMDVGSLGVRASQRCGGERRRGDNQICRHDLREEVRLKQKTMDYVQGNVAS